MQSTKLLFCVVALATVCGIYAQQTVPSTTPIAPLSLTTEQWEKRVKTSADDPRQARKVVLDAIYANQTALVARDYEGMYNLKPSDVRLGTFGYAAVVSERFRGNDDDTRPYMSAFQHAAHLLQHACAPEEELSPAQAGVVNLQRSQDANAWLAWGDLRLRMGFDVKGAEKAYWQALKLDPHLAEAYWWLADLTDDPYTKKYFDAHLAQGLKYVNYAEKLEPKLHPFCVKIRSDFYFGAGPTRANETHALALLKEFVHLWPKNPNIDPCVRLITQVENYLADPNFR